jgi:cytochrome c biogenesis protein CcdA
MSVKEFVIHLIQVVVGVLAICFSLQQKPLRGRDGKSFSNQAFMRAAFFIVGVTLVLGGLGSVALAWRISTSQHNRFLNL